jgi:hypothetical protein
MLPTTNAGTWAPKALAPEKKKRSEESDGGAKRPKPSLKDPLGEPPPWFQEAAPPAVETGKPTEAAGSSTSEPAPFEAAPSSDPSPGTKDEIVQAAPRLVEHIKNPGKFAKVATMACKLLEDGRVNKNNSEAFFEVLEAGMLDPKRVKEKALRAPCRALYNAALQRKDVFSLKRQATLRLWQMRVINQIDLHAKEPEQVLRICREIRQGLMILPCLDPALEPPARSGGGRREMMPAAARPVWAEALFECLSVAMSMVELEWARCVRE